MKIGLITLFLGLVLVLGNLMAQDGECPNCHKKGDGAQMSRDCGGDCAQNCPKMKKDKKCTDCEKCASCDNCKDKKCECKKDGGCPRNKKKST
jgi:hypothetical protein